MENDIFSMDDFFQEGDGTLRQNRPLKNQYEVSLDMEKRAVSEIQTRRPIYRWTYSHPVTYIYILICL